MKKIFLTLIFSLALIQILQAQWTQIGPDILGDVNGDRLGFRNALAEMVNEIGIKSYSINFLNKSPLLVA